MKDVAKLVNIGNSTVLMFLVEEQYFYSYNTATDFLVMKLKFSLEDAKAYLDCLIKEVK